MNYGPPGYPPSYPPPPPPPPPRRPRRNLWILFVGLGVVVVLLAVLGVVYFTRSSGEIFLEPAANAGADPFTPVVAPQPPNRIAQERGATPTPRPTPGPDGRPVVVSQVGGMPGLYGGTRNVSSCDVEQLIAFLGANPALGQAWAQVHGITYADISSYVRTLTPVILRSDTRVTNHGFANGRATPRQAVLQAGSAVLVDRYGVPRVRCYCGNPLLAPAAVPATPTHTGPRWPEFDPVAVTVVVQNTTIINVITLIDVDTGLLFDRPIGGLGQSDVDRGGPPTTPTTPTQTTTAQRPTSAPPTTGRSGLTAPPDVTLGQGDVQVTLLWQGPADLDLRVVDPQGSEISYTNRISPSGGQLDVDANAGCGPADQSTHAENVFWPAGQAPPGPYSAAVNLYSLCSTAQVGYELTIRVDGAVVDRDTGSLTSGSSAPVSFTR